MQTLVKHFGGSLEQDLDADHGYSKDVDDLKANKLKYTKQYELLSKETLFVGSWHHQGCKINKLPDSFELIASTDGIVEFAKHKTLPIVIEQSHPERNFAIIEEIFINSLLNLEYNNEEI
jgi:gamma-glutamyl-gamma-aminobutyrate hydrolase PuuD